MEKSFLDNKLQISFKFVLGIRGNLSGFENDFAEFKKYKTKFIKKGTKTSASALPCDADFFQYFSRCEYVRDLSLNEQVYNEKETGFRAELSCFLEDVLDHKFLIDKMNNGAECTIRIAIQSDEAQLYFEMFPEHIRLLSEIGLKCEFSVLSWGMVG